MTTYLAAILLAVVLARASQAIHPAGPGHEARGVRGLSVVLATLAGASLVTVGAFRWRVGTDYWTYEGLYRLYRDAPVANYGLLNEPGIRLVAKVGSFLYDDPAVLFALSSIITLGLGVWTVYRTSPSFALSLALFAVTGPWVGSFNGIRQFLACAIIFAGHTLILERRLGRWTLVVLAASLFHVSALVVWPLYFVPRQRVRLSVGVLLFVGAALVAEAYGRILEVAAVFRTDVDLTLSNSYVTEALDPLRLAVAVAPVAFFVLFTRRSQLRPNDNFYIYLLIINAAALLASSGSAYVARFAIFSGTFLCLGIPRLLVGMDPRPRAALSAAIVVLYSAFWYIETSNSPALSSFTWVFDRPGGL